MDTTKLTFTLADLLVLMEAKKRVQTTTKAVPTKVAATKAVPTKVKAPNEVVITVGVDSHGESCLEMRAPYNHNFRGFAYANTKKVGKPAWKWNPKKSALEVPHEDTEILLQGVRETFKGAVLKCGDMTQTL